MIALPSWDNLPNVISYIQFIQKGNKSSIFSCSHKQTVAIKSIVYKDRRKESCLFSKKNVIHFLASQTFALFSLYIHTQVAHTVPILFCFQKNV